MNYVILKTQINLIILFFLTAKMAFAGILNDADITAALQACQGNMTKGLITAQICKPSGVTRLLITTSIPVFNTIEYKYMFLTSETCTHNTVCCNTFGNINKGYLIPSVYSLVTKILWQ